MGPCGDHQDTEKDEARSTAKAEARDAHCATGGRIEIFDLADASPSMRVRHDNSGVACESLASHDPFFHTARHDGLEQLTQEIALTKPAVAVLGEGRMIGNVAVEPQATEPLVSQIEVDNRV